MSQFIEIFYGMETTPVKDYIDDSFPGEWGTEDKDGNGVKGYTYYKLHKLRKAESCRCCYPQH